MIYAKFGWNWPNGTGEEDFLNSTMYFRNFKIISLEPLFEKTWIPYT